MTDERRTVLVVDDEEADRVTIAALLDEAGYRVVTAVSGREALLAFVEHPIRAVVADIVMADGDGVSLIAWLHSLKPGMPVVAVSGKGETGLRAARSMGAREAIRKPVDPEELVRVVGEAVGPLEE